MLYQATPQPEAPVDIAALPRNHRLDQAKVAAILGVSITTLGIWRSTGRYALPYLKVGRKVFYRAGDLLGWMNSRIRTHTEHTEKPARRKRIAAAANPK